MATIVANYDGPLYLVLAKTLYNTQQIGESFSFPLPLEYYAAHFPLFPALIRLISLILGYPYAMLLVTVLSSILALYFFNKLGQEYTDKQSALWLTLVFSIFPARWLIVRSIGSPEPLFIASILASIYFFKKKKYWPAGIWGVIAQLTKSAGILLFIAYLAIILFPKLKTFATKRFKTWLKSLDWQATPVLLIPLALLAVFFLYKHTFNDFLAYFHSGNNIHLLFPPFQIFNYSQPWVGTFWLEEIIFIYLFGLLGLLSLIKQKRIILAWFVGIFFATTIFISHRDLLRYSLPIVPFILIAFSDFLNRKEFKIALAFLIIPIYLFALSYIAQNIMPISDWAPLL